ncbi:MAG: LysR family transcriptional regulator [Sporolactobacillus sp.]
MSLMQYHIFIKIAETGSFTQAAQQLHLTQSAVSHAIAHLENQFEFPLLHRSRSGLLLTHEGERMLPIMQRVVRENEQVRQEANAIRGLLTGEVHVGVFTSVSRHWLPKIIHAMDQAYPSLVIKLYEGNYQFIEECLINGKLDCGFMNQPEIASCQVIPLKKDRLFCVVSKASELYSKETADLTVLAREPFIMPAFGGNHEVKQYLNQFQLKPPIRFELMEENAILAMIANDLGISILPELVLPDDLSPLRALPLKGNCYRTLGMAIRKPASPATRAFVDVSTQLIAQMGRREDMAE